MVQSGDKHPPCDLMLQVGCCTTPSNHPAGDRDSCLDQQQALTCTPLAWLQNRGSRHMLQHEMHLISALPTSMGSLSCSTAVLPGSKLLMLCVACRAVGAGTPAARGVAGLHQGRQWRR